MDVHDLAIRHSSKDPNWRTPGTLVDALERVFRPFHIDLAATEKTSVVRPAPHSGALATCYLGPDHPLADCRDALQVSWATVLGLQGGWGFLNPPYSKFRIKELRKALKREQLADADPAFLAELAERTATQIRALRIENWAQKAYEESLQSFHTVAVMPYAPQTEWFRRYVMGHQRPQHCGIEGCDCSPSEWSGHAALDYWRIPHRINFLREDGSTAENANTNHCIVHWGPNPGFVGPWVPSGRYWSYR